MAVQLNEVEVAILVSCFKNSSTKPDFAKVAQECSLKDSKTAYYRHWQLMKKFGMTGTRPKASKANQKKRPAPTDEAKGDEVDGDGDGEEVVVNDESPTKKEKLSL